MSYEGKQINPDRAHWKVRYAILPESDISYDEFFISYHAARAYAVEQANAGNYVKTIAQTEVGFDYMYAHMKKSGK